MKIIIPYEYTEQIILKRCRKPRPVKLKGTMSISVHEVSSKDAPIAILEHNKTFSDETNQYGPITIEYRWWHNELWLLDKLQRYSHAPLETQTAQQFTLDPYPMTNGTSYYTAYRTRQEQRQATMNWASTILFIDGMRWKQAKEPRYTIYTFGLGYNHAGIGTSLSVDNHYNPNISKSRYFRIDQEAKALETAIAIALRRGDDKAVSYIKKHTTFDILIPEAIRLNPNKEHGEGDPFINKLEGIIEASPCKEVTGLMIMKEAVDLLSS